MGRHARTHNPVGSGPTETQDMPGADVIGVEQRLLLRPATEHRVAGVPRILEDCPNCAALPPVGWPVSVLLRATGRRTEDAVAIQPNSDCAVASTVQVLRKDAPNDFR